MIAHFRVTESGTFMGSHGGERVPLYRVVVEPAEGEKGVVVGQATFIMLAGGEEWKVGVEVTVELRAALLEG